MRRGCGGNWASIPHSNLLDEPHEKILEGAILIVRYDSEADVVLVKLRDEPPVDAVEEDGGIVISYGVFAEDSRREVVHEEESGKTQKG